MTTYNFSINYINQKIATVQIATAQDPYLREGYVEAFGDVVETLNQDKELHCVIFTGTDKYFCAGASQESLIRSTTDTMPGYVSVLPRLILSLNIVSIACMQGHAISGGLALGLWCDFAYLSLQSLYGANFMQLGFTPGMGSSYVLERAFGEQLAQHMIFSGEMIKGRTLKDYGVPIAYAIGEKEKTFDACMALAETLSETNRQSLLLLKQTIATRRLEAFSQVIHQEKTMHEILFKSEETIMRIKKLYPGHLEKE